jgi:hypothetical protein
MQPAENAGCFPFSGFADFYGGKFGIDMLRLIHGFYLAGRFPV